VFLSETAVLTDGVIFQYPTLIGAPYISFTRIVFDTFTVISMRPIRIFGNDIHGVIHRRADLDCGLPRFRDLRILAGIFIPFLIFVSDEVILYHDKSIGREG